LITSIRYCWLSGPDSPGATSSELGEGVAISANGVR
jgi:hypothetical protein